jgi:hypothetical protein
MKGEPGIRMVYNGTSSGLNAHLLALWFALPTISTLLRALDFDTFVSDLDIAEMFLNFMLEEKCQRLAGVDLTHYIGKGEGAGGGARHLGLWGRCLMGETPPYQMGQGVGHAKDRIMGNPMDLSNAYHWSAVRLNHLGSELYDPRMAWVVKVRPGERADADLFIYMDDFRPMGQDEEEC